MRGSGRRRITLLAGIALTALLIFGAAPRAAFATDLTIQTDRTQYAPGDPIQFCYTVPGPGAVLITDHPSDGSFSTLASFDDDGTGGCFDSTVTPPLGKECLDIKFGSSISETCFTVIAATATGSYAATEAQDGQTLTLKAGDTLTVTLGSTYWQLGPSAGPNVLALQGTSVATPDLSGGCVPGQGCGMVRATYQAIQDGSTQIFAGRVSCGEALRCTPEQSSFTLNVVVEN